MRLYRLFRTGASLAVVIPPSTLKKLGWLKGTSLEIQQVNKNEISIKAIYTPGIGYHEVISEAKFK